MILDSTFLIDYEDEVQRAKNGPCRRFLHQHRNERFSISAVSVSELAAGMKDNETARKFLSVFHVITLKVEFAYEAAAIDRKLIKEGRRLGEADTLIAGTARYWGVPLVSNDSDFDRVEGLRRISY